MLHAGTIDFCTVITVGQLAKSGRSPLFGCSPLKARHLTCQLAAMLSATSRLLLERFVLHRLWSDRYVGRRWLLTTSRRANGDVFRKNVEIAEQMWKA